MSDHSKGQRSPRGAGRRQVCLFFLASMLLLVVLELATPPSWKTWDAPDYRQSVTSILEGRPFQTEAGKPIVRYPPIFPLLLSAQIKIADELGISRTVVSQGFNVLFTATTASMIFLLASRIVRDALAAALAAAMLLMPHHLAAMFLNLSVVPFLTCVAGAALCVLKQVKDNRLSMGWSALTGLLLAMAMLIRPIALFLPLVFAPAVFLAAKTSTRVRRTCAMAVMLTAVLIAILPWEVWSSKRSGHFVLLSSGGIATLRDGISFNLKSWRTPLEFNERLDRQQRLINREYGKLSGTKAVAQLVGRMWREDPLAVTQLYGLKILRSWYGLDTQDPQRERWLKVALVFYGVPSLLAFSLFVRRIWPDKSQPTIDPDQRRLVVWTGALTIALVLYFWAFTAMFISLVRYMIPAFAFLPLLWASAIALYSGNLDSEGNGQKM